MKLHRKLCCPNGKKVTELGFLGENLILGKKLKNTPKISFLEFFKNQVH